MRPRSFLLTVVVVLLVPFAAALDLPNEGKAVLLTEQGSVVGVGEIEGGGFQLLLEPGFSGHAALLVTGVDGTVLALDVLVRPGGQILVVDGRGGYDLGEVLAAGGGNLLVEVAPADPADQVSVEESVTTPSVAGESEVDDERDDGETLADELPEVGAPALPEGER